MEYPVIFSQLLEHARVANRIGDEVISAGFVEAASFGVSRDPKFDCYGKSVTLGIASRPKEDGELIKRHYQYRF